MYLTPTQFSQAFNDIKKTSLSHSTCKLVIFVSCLDIDSLCSAKMLCAVFKKELISYQLVPIVGYSELKAHYGRLDNDVTNVILVGCGAMVDLEAFLDIDSNEFVDETGVTADLEDLDNLKNVDAVKLTRKIYIIDGRRPWNLDNLFGSQMVVCFDEGGVDRLESEKTAYVELVNAHDSEFESEEEEEEETDEDEEEGESRKRRKSPNSSQTRKRQLRQNESVVEDYYSQGTSIEVSTTAQVYSLVLQVAEHNIDYLWLSIVGTTSIDNQYPEVYQKIYPMFKDEVVRLCPRDPLVAKTADSTTLSVEKDYYLFLLRHWSLYNSFFYSNYVNAKLTLWSEEGKKKLHKMFAKMGISLQIANQSWLYMDINIKKSLNSTFRKYLGLYDLDDLIREGFIRTYGYRGSISAQETVESITALLEHDTQHTDKEITDIDELMRQKERIWVNNFWASWDALDKMDLIEKGLVYAKEFQQTIFRTGMAILEKRQIKNLRLYRLVVLKDGPDLEMFKNPLLLTRLGSWLLECCAELDSNLLPLVLAALDVETDTFLVIGLAPRYPRGSNKDKIDHNMTLLNTFGVAFQQVANNSGAKVKIDSFESSVIEIRKDDLAPFLERLTLSGGL